MKYSVFSSAPETHFIDFVCTFDNPWNEDIKVNLSAWRPGRYELGNFARNIRKWKVSDEQGNPLRYTKTAKDSWLIHSNGAKTVSIEYDFFASEINAGSSYVDETQLYINPVNCFLYLPEHPEQSYEISFRLPDDYKIACSLPKKTTHILTAENFDELADSPLIASNSLKRYVFVLDGVEFNLWFQGECKPDSAKLVNDFFIFINEQFVMMKDFPSDEFHFLFQILPHKFYHGVEHLKSTVIALGPGYNLMHPSVYQDLLGVSSHELFHCWNIKTIRPAEMSPYDFTKENYSRSGYVYEGITTYYGDLLLYRSGVFSEPEYRKTFDENLQKHFDNYGRLNLSVADSSFDTWLDGYVPGIPHRKVSIYTEGALLAFISDILIRQATGNDFSLDDVMRELYEHFGKKKKGYTEQDYKTLLEKVSGINFTKVFEDHVWGTKPFNALLDTCLSYVGWKLQYKPSPKHHESGFGFKVTEEGAYYKISTIAPGSPAERSGLSVNDKIIAVNGMEVNHNFNELVGYHQKKGMLTFFRSGKLREVEINPDETTYYGTWNIVADEHAGEDQKQFYKSWTSRIFNDGHSVSHTR